MQGIYKRKSQEDNSLHQQRITKGSKMETLDLGNNEQISRGMIETADGFLAMTFTQSKMFKTRAGDDFACASCRAGRSDSAADTVRGEGGFGSTGA